jgi:hypothetical protein
MDDLANPRELWQAMVATAVLGTDRGGKPATLPRAIADVAAAGADFLAQSAAVGVYLRAGLAPPRDQSPLDAETSTPPAFKAAEQLRTILTENRSPLLVEWCEVARRHGRLVPFALLPEMFRRAQRDRALRPLLQPILGPRGQWLAGQNPQWRDLFAAVDNPDDVWQTGTPEQRKLLLAVLRGSDPDKARQLVESTWAEDSPEDRTAFLETFATGLSPADEPLLEKALDDKRKPVRDAATKLLARLPTSQLAHRMATRLAALVEYRPASKGLLRKKSSALSVTLPGEPDAAGKRDGLLAKARDGMGAQAALLSDIVAAATLSLWDQLSPNPDELIEAALAGEYAEALIGGWRTAAARQKSAAWAEALLRAVLTLKPQKQVELLPPDQIPPLIAAIPPQRAEALAIERLAARHHRAMEMLQACEFAWSQELSRAALVFARDANLQADYVLRHWLSAAAGLRMHPSLAAEAAKDWPQEMPPASCAAVDQFVMTLQFRHDMHKELAS